MTAYNLLQYEVFSAVFPIIVAYATGSSIVLQLWQSNPKLVLQGFLDIMKTDQGNMVKVLDICQELKMAGHVLPNAVKCTSWKTVTVQFVGVAGKDSVIHTGAGANLLQHLTCCCCHTERMHKFCEMVG
ncbi:hypothetical protein RHSIM_Rhsim03G0135000 [Rhododendron simsii]|uniref:CCR4-NOT transcription complex subunit 1 HEAT repeat domain-containing protein n=1 Tax=Rhododendron simsii TaxID=118357 RepID=A0A834LRA7_RHOSS|nr:hypothetical protein RHSIM_Rhsim03G0135000 [Rhododendron simsii]